MKRFLALLLMVALGAAAAHAELVSSTPDSGALLSQAPGQVELAFSEPLETLFSIFKVYRLDAEVDLAEDNAGQRLNGLAGALVNEVLELRDDTELRVDTGMISDGATVDTLSLLLNDELPAGHYVAMWRVLSIDTHVTQGFIVFTVAAE